MKLFLKFSLSVLLAVFSCHAIVHAQRAELVVQTGHSADVTSVAFSPDGQTLASGSWDNTIKLWDVITLVLVRNNEPLGKEIIVTGKVSEKEALVKQIVSAVTEATQKFD
jgi:WD40 repeat protein